MKTLADLRKGFAQTGQVTWIGLRPERKADLMSVDRAMVTETGLVGDHGRSGKRAVTLIQAEHLPVIAALSGAEVTADILRRNIVVAGINLTALREHQLQIGSVLLQITVPCAPCSRMEALLGKGGYNAMRGHGGWCASVISGGEIAVGGKVTPIFGSA